MTTQEHLNKILEKCRAFLEIAEKRTPGTWQHGDARKEVSLDHVYRQPTKPGQAAGVCTSGLASGISSEQAENDAAFIAACAGQAEAMARSTIAAVTDILEYWDLHKDTELVVAIIAAWPEETL